MSVESKEKEKGEKTYQKLKPLSSLGAMVALGTCFDVSAVSSVRTYVVIICK